jgi:hypothetical protein
MRGANGMPIGAGMSSTHTRPVVLMKGVANVQYAEQLLLELQQRG